VIESWSTAWNPAAALDRCDLLLSLVWRDARLRPVVDVQLSSAPEHKTTPSLVGRSLPRMISMYCTTCTLRTLAHSASREVARGILVRRTCSSCAHALVDHPSRKAWPASGFLINRVGSLAVCAASTLGSFHVGICLGSWPDHTANGRHGTGDTRYCTVPHTVHVSSCIAHVVLCKIKRE
jgi:hypothetical protein